LGAQKRVNEMWPVRDANRLAAIFQGRPMAAMPSGAECRVPGAECRGAEE